MAVVNNATGVYATLGYNFTDPNGNVQIFDSNTQNNLVQFPAIIETWQAQDIANNAIGGYFQNPVSNYTNTIITVAGEMFTLANTANIDNISAAASALAVSASDFLVHTNKISGVTSMIGQSDTSVNPYYQTATAYGKQAIMITNQTDGIVNNSPILGSMTSILVGPQINDYVVVLNNDLVVLTGALLANTLTDAQALQITNDLTNTSTFLTSRQSSDVAFFHNVQVLVNNHNTLSQFSNMGDTETYLCTNIIGTPKLISRLNS